MAIVIYLNFNKHQFQNKHELLFLFLKKMKNSQKELLSNIGKNLRKIRESKSYTQKELAAAMQMDASQYHKLEAGKTVPTILTLERAAKALKAGIEVIINGNINPIDNTNIKDKSLFEKMKMVDELPDEDKTAIFRMIELASKQKKFSEIFQTNTVRP